MRHAKFVGALCTTAFVLALVVAAPALANDPEWVICELTATGKLDAECGKGSSGKFEEVFLAEKKSKEIKAEQNGAQVLKLPGLEAECTKLKAQIRRISYRQQITESRHQQRDYRILRVHDHGVSKL